MASSVDLPLAKRELAARSRAFLDAARKRIGADLSTPKVGNWHRAFFELYQDLPLRERQARSMAYALVNEPVCLLPNELLVGMNYESCPGAGSPDMGNWQREDARDLDAHLRYHERIREELPELLVLSGDGDSWISQVSCAPGHIGWHWDWIVRDGVDGVRARIDAAWKQVDDAGREFLAGMRICLDAMLSWNEKHIDALSEALEKTDDPAVQKALQTKLTICRRVPKQGARNFREAVQSFHFSYLATFFENPHGGNGPGRLDYFLWPYLKRDLAEGVETVESARELIDELFVRFHERMRFTADGHVETIVVAGSDLEGRSAANPLSRIMVESIASLGISHPSVYIRLPQEPDEAVLQLAAEDLVGGGNRAQVISDRAVVGAMVRAGIPAEDARMYMCGGCMEISPMGMNSDLLFTNFFNVPKILELVLTGGTCLNTGRQMLDLSHGLAGYANFESLYGAFERELQRILTLTFQRMDIASEEWAQNRPRFLASSQIDDCIARGRGILDGGARYEDYGSTPLGIPNAGDALYTLQQAIFVERFVTAKELLAALQADFAGYEPLRRRLLALPKFGQGHTAADHMTDRVTDSACDAYDRFTNRHGGRVKPMIMTFRMASVTGRALGATPDGRQARTPITQGLTPQSHAMTHGLSTAILSANSLDLERFSGGAATMWDLDPSLAKVDRVRQILAAFAATGGQMFQGNVTDVAELRHAQEDPEKYANLLVRVGGFSARFVALSQGEQDDVIARYRHTH
jgi:trans-4-hydroxy-L-proline dehydratase